MFKSWSKKNRIKAVFKLQFQATQVPKLKKSSLMISLVPEDVGKPTVRLEKAAVQDGTCSWENPVYETVKLNKESKTGKINEKIYHFAVSTGSSSKSGFLGEASIDFADFAAETTPLTVSLPLKFANSGAVLHVTIQKMEGGTDQRDGEEYGAPTLSHDDSLNSQQSNCDTDGNDYNLVEDRHLNDQNADGIFRASTGASDTLASCWDNSLLQSTRQDFGLRSPSIHDEPTSFSSHIRQNSIHQKGMVDGLTTKNNAHQRSNTNWSVDSASEGSLVDSINSIEDNLPRVQLRAASDDSIEKLKNEITSLMRQAELSEMELQSLRKQVVKEKKQGENLSRQIISLREEKDALQMECDKSLQKRFYEAEAPKKLQSEIKDTRVQLESMRQELNYEKKTSDNLQLQLQKTQDSNAELIDAVRDLEEMLERKNKKISNLYSKIETLRNSEDVQDKNCTCKMNGHENQKSLEELAKEHSDAKEIELLEQKIRDLNGEIDFYKKHKEELDMHTKQLSLDYELLRQENNDISFELGQNQRQQQITANECATSLATINELESQVERLEEKIKKQAEEFSESLVSINELESQVKGLEKELEKQAQRFEEDLNAVTCAKTEQEQRAIRAEEALRKTRWNNAITAERLQEEVRRLSVEMASKLDENEKLTKEAQTEADELRAQKRTLEEQLQKATEELRLIKDQNEVKLQELLNQIDLKAKQIGKMSLELDQKSNQLEYAQEHERENHEANSMEIKMLKAEVERLTTEQCNFSEQAKKEHTKTKIGEKEMLMQKWNKERDDLQKKLTSAKKKAETAHEELISMKSLKDEKEIMNTNLQSEVENLRARHNELKRGLCEEELEKENLRKQISQVKCQLQKKEEEITSIEKKLMNCNSALKEVIVAPQKSRLENCSETVNTNGGCTNLLTEMALLKERNKSMEKELKEMQERYSEISLKFAEVEGERQQLVMTVRNLKNGKKN